MDWQAPKRLLILFLGVGLIRVRKQAIQLDADLLLKTARAYLKQKGCNL